MPTQRHARVHPDDLSKSTRSLLERARAGDSRAVSRLFQEQRGRLLNWARGRVPRWVRHIADTADLVQEALVHTFQRLNQFEDRGKGALQAYLRQAVTNRIADHMRTVARRPTADLDEHLYQLVAHDESPFEAAAHAEWDQRYKAALNSLDEDDRLLAAGRLELGLSYEQLALVTGRATPGAARLAARRAVIKLAQRLAPTESTHSQSMATPTSRRGSKG